MKLWNQVPGLWSAALAGGLCFAGCTTARVAPSDGPAAGTAEESVRRDTAAAEELVRQGRGARTPEQGEALFRRALEADPGCAAAHNNLGVSLLRRGRYAEAAGEFDAAARLRPMTAEPHFNLGLLYQEVGKHTEAIREYEMALELNPDCLEAAENCILIYVHLGIQKDRTRELAAKALERETREEMRRWLQEQSLRLGPAGDK